MDSTIIEIIISEAQNEIKDFAKWNFDIVPHRAVMNQGFETAGGKRIDVETAFKTPEHPFRVAVVCAMWLTGFDVECLSTLYIDKAMKAHTLMQAIARANRVYPGKTHGVIVDYNGMLSSLREAMARYSLVDDEHEGTPDVVAPIEEMVAGLQEAIETAEEHLKGLGFDVARLTGAKGFPKIEAIRDAVDTLYTTDAARRRFEIMAREMFARFKALVTEPSIYTYAARHDNIEAIYKKLSERRDLSDVTEVVKALHRIVNSAIAAHFPGEDHATGLTVDLSAINLERLREEFAKKVCRKQTALQDIRELIEAKLHAMLGTNPQRMDFYKKYMEVIADYNREKDRVTVEDTFARLVDLAGTLDEEEKRAAREGLNKDELALFDLLYREKVTKADRERLKQSSRELLAKLTALLVRMERWTEKEQTQAEVKVLILDELATLLPNPPYTPEDAEVVAESVYSYVWQRCVSGLPFGEATAA